ncbi:MAG: diaminopimelate epimerase [Acidobacteriia bacterium]|nr:diaminopimelate epimerase [Terriglobia bacterium]
MPMVPFTKAHGCGNDFLLIEGKYAPKDLKAFAVKICDRHRGIGADGVEWIFSDPQADARARLFNADGSEAEISGNGTRCVAAYLVSKRKQEKLTIRTGAGIKTCTLVRHDGNQFEFETAMGEPQVGNPLSIKLAFGEQVGIPVSMGNPHFVLFVDEFAPGWQAKASEIEHHHHFKFGTNVELVRAVNKREIYIRVFERGVGETQSSGTGSCASAVAAIASGRAQSPVLVKAPGGEQTVRWEGGVFLAGPAEIVCRGEFFSQ